jgi:ribosomal protein S18 acetylase RimI-like enzyme
MPDAKVGVAVRSALPGDLRACARLGARLARWHHQMDPRRFFVVPSLEEGYAWWLGKERRNPGAVVLAAVRRSRGRERVVGYAYGRIEPRDWNTLRDRCGVGIDLIVEPASRRRGVGRLLVDELVRRLAEKGAPRVVIQVAARNGKARGVFAGLGFRPTMLEMAIEARPARRAGAGPRPSPRRRGGTPSRR